MNRQLILSLRPSSWGFSVGLHLLFVGGVYLATYSRMIDLPLVTLDLTPLASSANSAPQNLDEWRKPHSKHKMVSVPTPKPTPALATVGDNGPVRSVAEVGQMPRMKTVVKPVYPPAAKQAGVEGVVILQVEIDASGAVMDAQVAQSLGSGCDEAALDAVKQTVFVPAYADGKPVPVRIRIPYRFKIGE